MSNIFRSIQNLFPSFDKDDVRKLEKHLDGELIKAAEQGEIQAGDLKIEKESLFKRACKAIKNLFRTREMRVYHKICKLEKIEIEDEKIKNLAFQIAKKHSGGVADDYFREKLYSRDNLETFNEARFKAAMREGNVEQAKTVIDDLMANFKSSENENDRNELEEKIKSMIKSVKNFDDDNYVRIKNHADFQMLEAKFELENVQSIKSSIDDLANEFEESKENSEFQQSFKWKATSFLVKFIKNKNFEEILYYAGEKFDDDSRKDFLGFRLCEMYNFLKAVETNNNEEINRIGDFLKEGTSDDKRFFEKKVNTIAYEKAQKAIEEEKNK